MATITGTLTDAGLEHLTGKHPEIRFILTGPATSGPNLFVTDPETVTPSANGVFSVNLAPTTTMQQKRWYRLEVRWLDSAGNFVRVDYPQWKISVPVSGGEIGELTADIHADGGWNPLMVFWSDTEPAPWPVGSYWVDTTVDTPTSGDVRVRKAA